jgi:hypothetical protein
MTLSEFEVKRVEKAVEEFMKKRRPPAHIRHQLDFGYRIKNQSIELFEIRPVWNNPKEKIEGAIAKATYVKTRKIWKIYWQRADLKWHEYKPNPEVKQIEYFLSAVDQDDHGCFFG